MFDIGFSEIVVVMIVALLVVGPERLPGLARKAGLWAGRAKRFMQNVKADIDREIAAEELKRVLKDQSGSDSMYDIIEETKQAVADVKETIEDTRSTAENQVREASSDDAPRTEELAAPEPEYQVKAVSDKPQAPAAAHESANDKSGN